MQLLVKRPQGGPRLSARGVRRAQAPLAGCAGSAGGRSRPRFVSPCLDEHVALRREGLRERGMVGSVGRLADAHGLGQQGRPARQVARGLACPAQAEQRRGKRASGPSLRIASAALRACPQAASASAVRPCASSTRPRDVLAAGRGLLDHVADRQDAARGGFRAVELALLQQRLRQPAQAGQQALALRAEDLFAPAERAREQLLGARVVARRQPQIGEVVPWRQQPGIARRQELLQDRAAPARSGAPPARSRRPRRTRGPARGASRTRRSGPGPGSARAARARGSAQRSASS